MTPAIAYMPYAGWTACGAPFVVVPEISVIGAVLIIGLLVCAAAICFVADRTGRRAPLGAPPRGGVRILPRPTGLPQRA